LWSYVIPHFSRFLKELELEPQERIDAETKADRIARCLCAKYYSGEFNPNCYVNVGSYGKGTASRPPSDLDMLFLLPPKDYWRFESTVGNKQSQLLQEVKRTMLLTFPRTDLRADGQVVVAPFQTYNVEVIPAFLWTDGTYRTAHTAENGSWRVSNPVAEFQLIKYVDSISEGKATHLTMMLKAWKRECTVEIKSISLEVFACAFVEQWAFRLRSLFWYDWLVRDFFEFMLRFKYQGWTRVPGTDEVIQLGDAWVSKCQSAYNRSLKACEFERLDYALSAAEEWQKVFGTQFRRLHPFALAIPA
jgi:SMODS domain-containing protein